MDGIAKAKDIALSIFLGDDVVNNPFADVENFKFHRLVSNDLSNTLSPFFERYWRSRIVTSDREDDEDPFVPWLHYARKADARKIRVFNVVLIVLVKITFSMQHQMAEIGFD